MRSGTPLINFVSSIVEILFPHIYWPMPGMASYYWLSHTYVMSCYTAKTRRIRLIVALFSWIYNQMGFPGSKSMCRMQRLSWPGGLMFTLTIIARISFQRSANGFRNLSEKQREMMFLTFGDKKSILGAESEGPLGLLHKLEEFSRFSRSSRAFWVLVGLKRTPNDKVMTVLLNTGPLYGSPWKNFIFSWRVLARCSKILCPP